MEDSPMFTVDDDEGKEAFFEVRVMQDQAAIPPPAPDNNGISHENGAVWHAPDSKKILRFDKTKVSVSPSQETGTTTAPLQTAPPLADKARQMTELETTITVNKNWLSSAAASTELPPQESVVVVKGQGSPVKGPAGPGRAETAFPAGRSPEGEKKGLSDSSNSSHKHLPAATRIVKASPQRSEITIRGESRLAPRQGVSLPPGKPQSVDHKVFSATVSENASGANYRVVSLSGTVSQDQQPLLETFLETNMPSNGTSVIVNMEGLRSMSSSGWGLMVSYLQRTKKAGGTVAVCGMRGEVEECFKILEFNKLFAAYRTVSSAVQGLANSAKSTDPVSLGTTHLESMPLDEKIRHIVSQHPDYGTSRIAKTLRSGQYGTTKIGFLSLAAKLRSMNLGSKEERYRFFRSI
jgi:anti-anti-sigma factor